MVTRRQPLVLFVLALHLAPAAALAQGALPAAVRAQIAAVAADKGRWTPAQQKLDSHLIYAARMLRGEPPVAGIASLPRVLDRVQMDRQGTVTLDIKARVDEALLAALRRLGAQIISAFPADGAVRAQLPLAAVEAAAAIPAVRFIGMAQRPSFDHRATAAAHDTRRTTTAQAVARTEGDHAHGADLVRALGITGAGVRVGVLSDGVDSLAAQQAAGALGAVTVLSGQAGSGDGGTAMLEIVHTLAPDAQLYFATANGGDAQMAANITALQAAGCNVIADDVLYPDEGVFQDGPIARAAAAASAAGALYLSAAGNLGNEDGGTSGTWEGDFAMSSTANAYGIYHDFGGGNTGNLIEGDQFTTLQWSDPLGASDNDYDLYIFSDFNQLVDMSTTRQNGAVDPFEYVGPHEALDHLVVTLYSGSARTLHIGTGPGGKLYYSTAAAATGHGAEAGGVSVAATNVSQALGNEFLGGAQDPVEYDSADGFRRIFYQPDGTAVTPGNFLIGTNGGAVLVKPDLTAADCVSTNTPAFPLFCGTGAAAPHAAAIAALAFSMPNHPTAAQIKAAMLSSALDVMAPGADRDSGSGVVMADRLIAVLTPLPSPVSFYTVPPCRILDTRNAAGPLGSPALQAGARRTFQLTGVCGIPTGAVALSVNLTVTQTAAGGDLRVYPADLTSPPLVSAINFTAGQTRANNAIVKLGAGTGAIDVLLDSAASTHFILDVNGYFE